MHLCSLPTKAVNDTDARRCLPAVKRNLSPKKIGEKKLKKAIFNFGNYDYPIDG
jgi:hypothetical protein